MKKLLLVLVLFCALAGIVAACGTTPEPTEPPPTQTPWIVIVTATAGPEDVAQAQPTQTPWIIVATPTRSPKATAAKGTATDSAESPDVTEEPTLEANATPQLPEPTEPPDAADLKYPPPTLLEPPDGRPVSWKSAVLMKWSSVGELAEDEYYHLHMERRPEAEGQDWYGDYVYTKQPEYLAEVDFLAPFHPPTEYRQGTVHWWVRVVRKTGEDENGKPTGVDIGAHSEERMLILEAKPERD